VKNRAFLVVLLGLAALLIAPELDAQQRRVTFRLKVSSHPDDSEVTVVLNGANGSMPIQSPGWTCGWLIADDALNVECFPRDRDQGVTTTVTCPSLIRVTDHAVLLVSTHDPHDDAKVARSEIELSCQSR
jgi:hypothetical protein